MIKEHAKGQIFVIGINNWGLIKMRVNQHSGITLEQLDSIREQCTGVNDIGHAHAFTWKSDLNFTNFAQENMIKEAMRITNIITNVVYNYDNEVNQ